MRCKSHRSVSLTSLSLLLCSSSTLSLSHSTRALLAVSSSSSMQRQQRTMSSFTTSPPSSSSSGDRDVLDYVHRLYHPETSRPPVFSLYVTGGGVTALQWLLTVPGASQSIKTAQVPYSCSASLQVMGLSEADSAAESFSFCSEDVALRLAKAAYRNALENVLKEDRDKLISAPALSSSDSISHTLGSVLGVGCTASLVSGTPKRGEHRAFIALYSPHRTVTLSLVLDKGLRDRPGEDSFVSRVILQAIGDFVYRERVRERATLFGESELRELSEVKTIRDSERDTERHRGRDNDDNTGLVSLLSPLYESKAKTITFIARTHGHTLVGEDVALPRGSLVFPGSFNPVHEGHIAMVIAAVKALSHSPLPVPLVVFEIAAVNADKPSISLETLTQRVSQFLDNNPTGVLSPLEALGIPFGISVTSQPLFVGKGRLFPGSRFLIGADTFKRVVDLKYYSPSQGCDALTSEVRNIAAFTAAMAEIHACNCSFVVCGRVSDPAKDPIAVNIQVSGSSHVIDNVVEQLPVFETMDSIVSGNDMARLLVDQYRDMFVGITEKDFRADISSTILRRRREKELLLKQQLENEKAVLQREGHK